MPQSRHSDILSHYANVDFEQKLTSNNFRFQQRVRFGIISYDIANNYWDKMNYVLEIHPRYHMYSYKKLKTIIIRRAINVFSYSEVWKIKLAWKDEYLFYLSIKDNKWHPWDFLDGSSDSNKFLFIIWKDMKYCCTCDNAYFLAWENALHIIKTLSLPDCYCNTHWKT